MSMSISNSINNNNNNNNEEDEGLGDYLNQLAPQMCESLYTSHESFFRP